MDLNSKFTHMFPDKCLPENKQKWKRDIFFYIFTPKKWAKLVGSTKYILRFFLRIMWRTDGRIIEIRFILCVRNMRYSTAFSY